MELSSGDIAGRRFKSAMRGYSRKDVRAFLDDVERSMRGLEERLAIESARAEHAERELKALEARIDAEIEEATAARHRMIEQAKREADEIVARVCAEAGTGTISYAAECAAAIVARAEADASRRLAEVDRVREEADAEAARTVAAAEQDAATTRAEATRVLDEARREARAMRVEAEAERAAIVEEITRLERIATAAADGDVEALEAVNVILRSGTEITIDLRDAALDAESSKA